ncbi:MAG: aldehyde dehydrogenase family protein [Oligoflexia bacterium]|nr:aldehyde dehydrogenase family protein [Oligoflexia bacterium]
MDFITSKNPATGEEILRQECFNPTEMTNLVQRARLAQEPWRRLSFKERAKFLKRGQQYMLAHMDELALNLAKNNGKPLVEALSAEVFASIQTYGFAMKRAEKLLTDTPIHIGGGLLTKKAYITYQPLGVLGIISPWNYPLSTPFSEVILGLIAGNAIILKPSEITGLVNQDMQKIIDAMKLPKDLVTLVHGRGDVGAALASAKVDRLIFTGSTTTGRKIMSTASQNLTPVTLELGGKDCMIVLEDCNIELAASAAVVGGFFNTGQTCCSVERLLIHENIVDPFLKAYKEKLNKLRVGASSGFENDLGAITFEGQKKIYFEQTQDHVSHNQKTVFGDANFDGKSNFMKPLVVQADDKRSFWKDETFGPVVAYKTFKTDEEAISINNDSPYGLTALIISGNTSRARKMAKHLQVGAVVINDAPFTNACATLPWGGVGESGFGRVHGEAGLKELCQQRLVVYDIVGQMKQLWWYPYNKAQYDFFKALAYFTAGDGLFVKLKALINILKHIFKMGPRI